MYAKDGTGGTRMSSLKRRRHGPGRRRTKGRRPAAAARKARRQFRIDRRTRSSRTRPAAQTRTASATASVRTPNSAQRSTPPTARQRPTTRMPLVIAPGERVAFERLTPCDKFGDCPHCGRECARQEAEAQKRTRTVVTRDRRQITLYNCPSCRGDFRKPDPAGYAAEPEEAQPAAPLPAATDWPMCSSHHQDCPHCGHRRAGHKLRAREKTVETTTGPQELVSCTSCSEWFRMKP